MRPVLPHQACVRIIRPSGRGGDEFLAANLVSLEAAGLRVLPPPLPVDLDADLWPYTAGSTQHRLAALSAALLEEESQVLLCARGGYGCSDLLPGLPWERLRHSPPKWLVGFSDITALSCALWEKAGWPSIHGPMPASPLWGQNSQADIAALLALLGSDLSQPKQGTLSLSPLQEEPPLHRSVKGWLLGGCLSVLANLIGTPYLPQAAGAILLLEDTGENPGRLLRYFNQLLQSSFLDGVAGIVWGNLAALGSDLSPLEVKAELATRAPLPMWSSEDFGHLSPNYPFVIGAEATLDSTKGLLSWHYDSESRAKAGKGRDLGVSASLS